MRFTVKAKLISAFGAIIVISTLTGGVAYVKLSELTQIIRTLSGRLERMDNAGELKTALVDQVRAEKDLILASTDADIANQADQIAKSRAEVTRLHNAIYAATVETGKALLDKFLTEYKNMNKVQDETIRLGRLNSANRGAQYWRGDGVAAAKAVGDAFDLAFAQLDRTGASIETTAAIVVAQHAQFAWERAGKIIAQALAAGSADQLNASLTALKEQVSAAVEATQKATAALEGEGAPTAAIARATDQLAKAITHADEIAREGGNIAATTLSSTQGRTATLAALDAANGYVTYNRHAAAQAFAAGFEAANQDQILLIGELVATLVIAVGSAVWILLSICRGLGRAVELADAVAVGDLSHKIEATSDDEVGDLVKAFKAVIVSLSATAQAAEAIGSGDLSVDIKRRSDKDLLGVALEKMCWSLRRSAEVASVIASGDLSIEVHHRSEKDALGIAFERMVQNLRATAKVADAIAAGDLSVEVKRLSDKDTLGIALEEMLRSLGATAKVAEAIAAGDLNVQIKRLSDKDVLGIAFERMAQSLGATAKVAEAIAAGDLNVQIMRLSDKDVLGVAFERMAQSLGATAKAANAIASGAPKAAAVVAVGTCATYGGIPAMKNNPTGAMGVPDYLGLELALHGRLPDR